MIRKVNNGYKVYNEKGKPLSKTLKTREMAEKRLQQIHYFSNKKGK